MKDLFKIATKENYRFPSSKGELSVIQLWELPLNSNTKANLNDVAKEVSTSIKVEVDFVNGTTVDNTVAETKLEVVKAIIADKLYDAKVKLENEKILNETKELETIISIKEKEELMKLSTKALKKRIKELKSR